MATTLRTELFDVLKWTFRDTDNGRTVKDVNQLGGSSLVLENGTAANQADVKWDDQRTVNDAANDDLDLAGVLLNRFGGAATFAKVKGIKITNNSTTTGENLLVGGGSNSFASWLGAAGDIVTIGPGGVFVLWNPIDGYTVTAGTGDILRLTGSGGNITYDIAIIGTSA